MDIENYAKQGSQFYSDIIPLELKKILDNNQIKTILDVGCGDGSLIYALKGNSYLENRNILALDLSESRVNLVKNIDKRVAANVDSAETLETVQDKSIDLLISTQVIEHVDDTKMLESIYRVLNKDGIAYITTVYKKWYGWYFYRCNGRWVIDPTHLREYTQDSQLFNLIDTSKFKIIKNKKHLLYFPLVHIFLKILKISDRKIYSNRFLKALKNIQIPILGYYNWEIIILKIK